MSLGSCNGITPPKAERMNNLEYQEILSKYVDLADEILNVCICKQENLKMEHVGSHSEMIRVTFKNDNQNENGKVKVKSPLELFVKKRLPKRNATCPACPSLDRQMTKVILNEGKFLIDFVKEMKEFCKLHSNGNDKLIADLFPPTLYYNHKLIIMENMRKFGYRNLSTNLKHDFQHAKLVLENLARFHSVAYSIIMKEGGRKKFLNKHPNFENVLLNPELMHFFSLAFEAAFAGTLKILQNSSQVDTEEKYNFLKKYQGKLEQTVTDVLKCECLLVTVCHANLSTDNIMFCEETNGTRKSKVAFVDFQTSKVCSPNIDIGYYLFRSVNHEARQQWKNLLQIYFYQLEKNLISLGQPFDFIFEDFVKDFQRKCKLGFIFSVFLMAPGIDPTATNVDKISSDIIEIVNDYQLFTTNFEEEY